MTTTLTHRFILIGLLFVLLGGGVAFMVGEESRHDRGWVATRPVNHAPVPAIAD